MILNTFKQSGITLTLDRGNLLRVDGLKALPADQADQIREQIRQHRAEIIQELIQQRFGELWAKAWGLADWIDDNESGIDVEIRRAKLPELQQMIAELQRLEQAGAKQPERTDQ